MTPNPVDKSTLKRSVPIIGGILLLTGIAGILFGCGLCLGAAGTVFLTRQGSLLLSEPAGLTVDHPAPPGTAVRADDLEIRVTDAIRPADDIVAEGSPFNPKPGPESEMMLVTVAVTCRPARDKSTCVFAPSLDFLLIGSVGVHRPEYLVWGLPNPLEGGEIDAGKTVSGNLVFEVEKRETGLILVYSPSFGGETAYLEVP